MSFAATFMTSRMMGVLVSIAIYFGGNVTFIIIAAWIARKKKAMLRWYNLPLGKKVLCVLFFLPLLIFLIAMESVRPNYLVDEIKEDL